MNKWYLLTIPMWLLVILGLIFQVTIPENFIVFSIWSISFGISLFLTYFGVTKAESKK